MSFYARGVSPLVPENNRVQTIFTEPTITQQHFAAECNINQIIARFNKTGVLGDGKPTPPSYADVSLFGDFRESQEKIQKGKAAFAAMPVEVRRLAGGDPSRLWDVLVNPENRQILENAGVLNPRKPPVPDNPDGQSAQPTT